MENGQLLEQRDAVSRNSDQAVVVEVQLPQGTLEAVEGHRGDRTDHVVAYFELPHACNVNKFYRNVFKTFKINFKLDGSPGRRLMS